MCPKFQIYGKNLKEIKANTEVTNNPLVGYLLTETLSSKDHLDMINGKVRGGIYALKSNKALPTEVKKSIYYATIHSHLVYAGTITGCVQESQLKNLAKLQKIAMRIIDNAKYNAGTTEIFKKHKILKIQDLLKLKAVCYAWKYFHGELPSAISELMSTGGTRIHQLKGCRYSKEKHKKHSPIDYCIRTWNPLPLDLN